METEQDYNLRQISLMEILLSDLKKRSRPLTSGIIDLINLLDFLKTDDEVWTKKFSDELVNLELASSSLIERKETEQDNLKIEEIINGMVKLVAEFKEKK